MSQGRFALFDLVPPVVDGRRADGRGADGLGLRADLGRGALGSDAPPLLVPVPAAFDDCSDFSPK